MGLIRVFLLSRLGLPDSVLDSYDYRAGGDVDSIEFVRFILEIEKDFGVALTDADIESPGVSTIGGLVAIIERLTA